ncbi:MAG: hypothetical protein AAE986_00110 [Thermoplasmataceae archaeon]|jgi:hypothetical protein
MEKRNSMPKSLRIDRSIGIFMHDLLMVFKKLVSCLGIGAIATRRKAKFISSLKV